MGLPIVTTNMGALPEFVQPGVNGLLVPPGSPSQVWAEHILMLLDDPSVMRRFGEHSRQLAERGLSLQRFDDVLDEAFARTIIRSVR